MLAATVPPVAAVSVAATASAPSPGYTASQIPIPGRQSTPAVAVNSVTDIVYAGSAETLTVVNGATGSLITTVSLGGTIEAIAVDSATNRVYVTTATLSAVTVIDGATNTVLTTISVPSGIPTGVAVDSTTNTVYIANPTAATVTVIDGAANAVKATIGTGAGTRPSGVAADESTHLVWVADQSGSVIAIDESTDSIIESIGLGGSQLVSVAVNAATNTVYAADLRNGDVVVINGQSDTVTTLIPAGLDVGGIAVNQGSGVVYASGYATLTGTTWVIDGDTNHVTDTIGRGGFSVALNQTTGVLYESALRFGAVWAITPSATNAWSPVITTGTTFTLVTGVAAAVTFVSSALPLASFSETGTLPTGVKLSPAGALSGTPAASAAGTYPITLTASNGIAPDYSEQITIVVDQPLAITSGASSTFQVGLAGSFTITATGYPPPYITWSGTLPGGVTVIKSANGGELNGTPVIGSGGVYPITLFAYNFVSPEVQQAFTLTVDEAPSITSAATTTFHAGASGSFFMTSLGYPAPTFTETGKLPAGVTLNSAGVLSGTPAATAGGVYPITITASNGIAPDASRAFSLTVNQRPAFTSPARISWGTVRRHTFTFRTTGFPAAKLSERGALPSGVTFKAGPGGTAVLAGRPPRADRGKTYVITVTARNGVGAAVRQIFRLTIV